MPLFVHEYKPNLSLSNHCMHLPRLLKNACTQCQGSCISRTSSLSSEDDDGGSDIDIDLDNKYAIIMEIRSRAMKAKLKPEEVLFPRKHMIMNDKEKGVKECEEDDDDDYEEGSETFFSTRSCFSCCSSNEYNELPRRSILEDFRYCDGWPFGLCRRAVVLPPLPSSPSDSWQWHKRKLVSRTC